MKRIAKILGGLFVAVVIVGIALAWRGFGKSVTTERMRKSPQWQDGHFENPQPWQTRQPSLC